MVPLSYSSYIMKFFFKELMEIFKSIAYRHHNNGLVQQEDCDIKL